MTRLSIGSSSLFAAALLVSLAACEKTPEPSTTPAPAPSSAPAAAPATSAAQLPTPNGPADVAYDVPKAWEVVANTSPMRKATIKVPKQGGDTEDAELSVSSAGGTKDGNIARWTNQLGQAEPSKREERTVNNLAVTIVEVKGSYAGMGGGAKKDGYMLLGAIVPVADKQLLFFKMTGPEKTVTASRKDFDAFVASFRAK